MSPKSDLQTDAPDLAHDYPPRGVVQKTGAAILLAAIAVAVAGPVRLFLFPGAAHSGRTGAAPHHTIIIDAVSDPDQD